MDIGRNVKGHSGEALDVNEEQIIENWIIDLGKAILVIKWQRT